ncbi:hypothetical protein [Paractinoplanes durhamensis]|uniref:hypothetical protein n=1 Tax=Paractinoplanes durhamensis TaxID=113563 RepID=UPI00362CB6F0
MTTDLRRTLLAATAVLAIGFVPAVTVAGSATAAPHPTPAPGKTPVPADYDARHDPATAGLLDATATLLAAKPPAAVSSMRAALGLQGIVDMDALTGTPGRWPSWTASSPGRPGSRPCGSPATTSRRTPTCSGSTRPRSSSAVTMWTSRAPTT